MATVTVSYAVDAALTITLASLATSPTFVFGREATAVVNGVNKYVDAMLSGRITVGTTPTIDKQILVYVFGSYNDDPDWPDVFDGTDSDETITTAGVGRGFLKLAAVLDVDATTSDRSYSFGPVSVAMLFGGVLPENWSVFVTHNTGANFNSTAGNHEIVYAGIKYDVA